MNLMLTALALAFPIGPLVDPVPPVRQEVQDPAPPKADQTQERSRPIIPADELVMERFTPQNVTASHLMRVAHDMVGTRFDASDGERGTRPVQNLRTFDRTILIYDTAPRAREILVVLEQLDRIAGEEQALQAASEERVEEDPAELLEAREYRPKFLTLDDLIEALMPYRQRFPEAFSFVEESGFVVLTGPRKRTDEILGFLERIDVASPQLLVTCFLVRGTKQPPANPAPAELADGLRRLMGYEHVEIQARGLLRSSVSAKRLSLRLDVGDDEEHYELELMPAAYDREKGALTLADCRLLRGWPGDMTSIFRTQTTLYAGEYTVLGATGVAPQFIVIQCLGNRNLRIGGGENKDGAR